MGAMPEEFVKRKEIQSKAFLFWANQVRARQNTCVYSQAHRSLGSDGKFKCSTAKRYNLEWAGSWQRQRLTVAGQ